MFSASKQLQVLTCASILLCSYVRADTWYEEEVPQEDMVTTNMHAGACSSFRIYHNLWQGVEVQGCLSQTRAAIRRLHNNNFYAFTGNSAPSGLKVELTANQKLAELPVESSDAVIDNIDVAWVPGTTLALDFPFPAFPDNAGHWFEIILPVYKMIYDGSWAQGVRGFPSSPLKIDRILLLNLKRAELLDMFLMSLQIAFDNIKSHDEVEVVDTEDLLSTDPLVWIGFKNFVVATDRYTALPEHVSEGCAAPDGDSRPWSFAFDSHTQAKAFRAAAYAKVDEPFPPAGGVPKVITFMTAAEGEVIVNKYDVLAMLWRVASQFGWTVRPCTATTEAPFASHVHTMASTGLLVSRHGPLLATSILLPPGAAVYELLPYNWEWRRMSQLYRNMTDSVGDIHHFAWRPHAVEWAQYASTSDQKFSQWLPSECTGRSCVAAHARASLIVDVDTVEADLMQLLEGISRRPAQCQNATCHVAHSAREWPTQ